MAKTKRPRATARPTDPQQIKQIDDLLGHSGDTVSEGYHVLAQVIVQAAVRQGSGMEFVTEFVDRLRAEAEAAHLGDNGQSPSDAILSMLGAEIDD